MGIIEMITGSHDTDSLQGVLINELKDLFSAENQLLKALPKMEKRAQNAKLKQAFKSHLDETKAQVDRLREIGKELGTALTGKTCKAMEGLVEEGDEIISDSAEDSPLIDARLIGAAQRVEHYEMAAYGTVRAMAQELQLTKVAKLLDLTIKEEGAADKKLSQISEGDILPRACSMNDEEDRPRKSRKVANLASKATVTQSRPKGKASKPAPRSR